MTLVLNSQDRTDSDPYRPITGLARYALIAFGFLNVAVGTAGIFLPLLPTTVFLLIALWAFARSSPRFHNWLYHHPRLGPPVRAWHQHRAIATSAKILAVTVMTLSLVYTTLFVADDWVLPVIIGVILAPIAAWIVTRPNTAALASVRTEDVE